jgi:2'-5' RNA ligase
LRRYFAGIELDDATRKACASVGQRLRDAGFSAGFESADKLHLTLAFLGNIEEDRLGDIVGALQRAAEAISPFDLTLDRIGAFPHERNPRVVYVGARQQGAGFRSAATIVRAAYEGLGFTFKDDAVAHVTIARVKGGARRGPAPAIAVGPIPMTVVELALFESIFDPSKRRTRYETAARASLEAGADPRRP